MGARAESLGRSLMQSAPAAASDAAPAQMAEMRLGHDSPVQRSELEDKGSEELPTPASAIADAFDMAIPVGN